MAQVLVRHGAAVGFKGIGNLFAIRILFCQLRIFRQIRIKIKSI